MRSMPNFAVLTPVKTSTALQNSSITCERRLDVPAACLSIPGFAVTGSFYNLRVGSIDRQGYIASNLSWEHLMYTRRTAVCDSHLSHHASSLPRDGWQVQQTQPLHIIILQVRTEGLA